MVTLGNLTGVLALTWEFGANGYITELTIALVMTVASIVTGITGSLQQNRLIKSNQTFLMICIVII